jgi:hypothetical protein
MPNRPSDPASDYLHTASNASLESFELTRLNHAANLRREIAALIDQWIDETVQARLARCILEERALKRSTLKHEPLAPERQLPFETSLAPELGSFQIAPAPPMKLSRPRTTRKPAA